MTSLRIGDVERDQAAEELSSHFAAGRLDHAEFESRLSAAYAAKTGADLDPLFADLPGHQVQVPAQPAVAWQGPPAPFVLMPMLVVLILVGASIVAVSHGFPPVFLFVAFWVLRGSRRHHHMGRGRGF